MGRSFDISGDSFERFLYASQLVTVLLVVLFVAFPLDDFASVVLALLFGSLVVGAAVAMWRTRTDHETTSPGTAEDITYDPIADPGQAAKHRWEKAVSRLPARDDEED